MIPTIGEYRRCFQPRQWFAAEGEPDPFVKEEEDTFMWVYRREGERFVVGYFMPDGTWCADAGFGSTDEAAARVNYLNGGSRK